MSAQELTGRHRVLESVGKAVLQDRNKSYGNPEDNFTNIANLWNAWLGATGRNVNITGVEVAHMMALMKLARLATNNKHFDSIVDVAGYAACAGDFVRTGGEVEVPISR